MLLRNVFTAVLATALTITATAAGAAPVAVGLGAFGPGSSLTTFESIAPFTEANGLVVDGLTFTYGGGNLFAVIAASIDSANVDGQTLAFFAPAQTLTIAFDAPVLAFGTGFALIASPRLDALGIELFAGAASLGTVTFDSVLDPLFAGGFAGVQNDTPFDRVVLTFNDPSAGAFAVDNLRTRRATIPEPALLTLLGLASVTAARRRPRR